MWWLKKQQKTTNEIGNVLVLDSWQNAAVSFTQQTVWGSRA